MPLNSDNALALWSSLSHWDLIETLDWGEDRYGDNAEEDNKDDDDNGSSCALSPHVCQALY